MVCAEPDMLCSSMSLCACVGESSLRGACTPYSAHRACSSRSWRRSPTRTAGSRASSSWSPRSATARAPTGSISRASPTARSCSCRIRRTDEGLSPELILVTDVPAIRPSEVRWQSVCQKSVRPTQTLSARTFLGGIIIVSITGVLHGISSFSIIILSLYLCIYVLCLADKACHEIMFLED